MSTVFSKARMQEPLARVVRPDLTVTPGTEEGDVRYLVSLPESDESYEFGEEEYELLRLLDGKLTGAEVIAELERRFGIALSESDFQAFYEQLDRYGLLEPAADARAGPREAPPAEPARDEAPSGTGEAEEALDAVGMTGGDAPGGRLGRWRERGKEPGAPGAGGRGGRSGRWREPKKKTRRRQIYVWALPRADRMFLSMAPSFRRLRGPARLLAWSLAPSFLLAILILLQHGSAFRGELELAEQRIPFLLTHVANVVVVNLVAKLAQAIVFACYGGSVSGFGIVLAFGFYPRAYLDRLPMTRLPRVPMAWCFATPLLSRVASFSWGVLIWYLFRGSGTELATWAILLVHSSVLDFVIDGAPTWAGDGYWFLVSYFRSPPNILARSYAAWSWLLRRRELPPRLGRKELLLLFVYLPAAFVVWIGITSYVTLTVTTSLLEEVPDMFDRGSVAVIIVLALALAFRSTLYRAWKELGRLTGIGWQPGTPLADEEAKAPVVAGKTEGELREEETARHRKTGLMIAFLLLLCLPYPYSPGGSIRLLPPLQRDIQAPVDGRVDKVSFKGGDGTWIPAGTTIATLEAVELENAAATGEEELARLKAVVAESEAQLNRLLNSPRPEELEVATRKVEVSAQQLAAALEQVAVSRQQVDVARQQLANDQRSAEFSTRRAERASRLAAEDLLSQQEYEDEEKRAEADRLAVEKARIDVRVSEGRRDEALRNADTRRAELASARAEHDLVKSGPHPDDIERARKARDAARASVSRQEQQLRHLREELAKTELRMPIEGHIVTPYLDAKLGSYLRAGESFAVAEDNRRIQGEIRIPEYDAAEFHLGAPAKVKVLAFPSEPLEGRVTTVEPAVESPSGTGATPRYVRVLVELPNQDKLLKAGMTGYAKVEGGTKPTLIAFARPLIRFVQVEMWSWLP